MNKGHVSKKHTSFSPIQWQSQNPKPAKKNTYCPLLSGGWDRNGKKWCNYQGQLMILVIYSLLYLQLMM